MSKYWRKVKSQNSLICGPAYRQAGFAGFIFAPLPVGLALPKRLREGDAGRLCVKY